MGIRQISETDWLFDVRVWHLGKEYRQREHFTGGRIAARERAQRVVETDTTGLADRILYTPAERYGIPVLSSRLAREGAATGEFQACMDALPEDCRDKGFSLPRYTPHIRD